MAPVTSLNVFCSTPDVVEERFVVPLLAEPFDGLARKAAELGFDGLEFLPSADECPAPDELSKAVDSAGVKVSVINSGRMRSRGYALLHKDPEIRRHSIGVFKQFITLAGELGARVGLGLARGDSETTLEGDGLRPLMLEVFAEIAEHASSSGTFVMLEPADPGFVAAILTVREAVSVARKVDSPGFRIMLDTYQLYEVEDSIPDGFAAAEGMASHIHLYDPGHWSPGIRPESERMDWNLIRRSMDRTGFSGSASIVLPKEGDLQEGTRRSLAFLRDRLMDLQ
jgi:D-psicose/D-tagatose/L-ribulose 3-epimerase